MKTRFTHGKSMRNRKLAMVAKVSVFMLLAAFFQPNKLFAHTVDYFNSCGYICAGSTLNVSAHMSNNNSNSKINWQYRDNSKVWKCFVNGNNTINGVVFSVSGVYAEGALTTSPTLSIANAKTNLEDVEIRVAIADGGTPCASNPSYAVYGTDKSLRLHVLSGSDCSSITSNCLLGGCIGNTLSNSDGFYGGFEISATSLGAASTEYTPTTGASSAGQYRLLNNPQVVYSSFSAFAPHSGNLMMYVDGATTATKRIWYNTVPVVKGGTYQFSAWIANVSNTNNQKAIAHLKITGTNSAEATKSVTATAGDWQYVRVDYTASQTGSVVLSITDDNYSSADNDFVIDDICFICNGVPPPPANLSLGNQVWNDYDGDGKRDENEPGISGAPVSLYTDNNSDNIPDGAAIKTVTTDLQGHYQFTNLSEGRYIVSLPILPGYSQSPNTNTAATSPYPDNNVDDDDNLVRLVGPNGPGGIVYTNAITLNAGQEPITDGDDANGNNTMDLSECGNAYIGDFVWNDLNGNGIQDAGEPGIDNVLVTITFEDGRTASTLTLNYNAATNPNNPQFDGYYNFPNLGPGTYKISFATPAGLFASPSNQGSNDAKDSDPVNGGPVSVTIAANQSDFTIDAGFTSVVAPPPPPTCPNLSLGNMVFLDANDNGVKEPAEQGIGGLTVKLFADNNGDNIIDGPAISTIITAADGTYYFGNLAAGRYMVSVAPGSAYVQGSVADLTPDDNKDNDNNGYITVYGDVYSKSIVLSPGDEPINDGSDNNSNLTLDFGLKIAPAPCTNHCECHNDCNHTNCGHPNCGHNSCKNNCTHRGCGHANCGPKSWSRSANDATPETAVETASIAADTTASKVTVSTSAENELAKYAVGENIKKTSILVFPNPTNSYFTLQMKATKAGAAIFRISDVSGNILLTKRTSVSFGTNTFKFDDLTQMKSGTYDVQLIFNNEVLNQKLIIAK